MFFREKKTSKQPILQLVESYRNARGKVSQRVVVSLAGCWVPDELRKLVAVKLSHRVQGYQRILEEDAVAKSWVEKVIDRMEAEVKLSGPGRSVAILAEELPSITNGDGSTKLPAWPSLSPPV